MTYVLTLVGMAIRCECSSVAEPDYEFSLVSSTIMFDDTASAIEFVDNGKRLRVPFEGITSPVLANYAALKAQITTWRDAATIKVDNVELNNVSIDGTTLATAAKQDELKAQTILNQNVGGYTNVVGVEVVRPANATPYAALDAISDSATVPTIITFTDIAKVAAGSGYITKIRAMTDKKDFTARIRLHLYNTAPTPVNDNDPFLLLYANKDKRIGHIDLPAFSTEDATNSTAARSQNYDIRMAFACVAASKNIYAMAEILDAATPASGQKFYFELTAENNA